MHAVDDFEIIRIRMKAIARDEGKPPIEVSAGNPTQPGWPAPRYRAHRQMREMRDNTAPAGI
jgi:hypothetical protein